MNHHITEELAASHQYLAAAARLDETGLRGMGRWMLNQSDEERQHAMRFLGHIHARHGTVRLEQIPAPAIPQDGAVAIFQDALRLEETTTRRIDALHASATKAGDVALRIFLDAFIQEQVQEEDVLRTILDRFHLAGDDHAALLMLDQELGARTKAA
ncbi:MAG TPA: ferritin, partial [Candidatus Thermoplasmatota archaeon]|nr:ferritin [Candidatus Thermoplasmatota archaeon]